MNRREAREAVFGLIYEAGFHGEDYSGQFELSKEVRELKTDEYVIRTYKGVTEHMTGLDELIDSCSVGWKHDRISRVTMAILRLCTYEMLYIDDIPYNVSINEAVELAKKYDDDNAPAFVNGIVNKIADDKGLKTK
nr:transcription antitermination factor NusB [Clostridia bacterium]